MRAVLVAVALAVVGVHHHVAAYNAARFEHPAASAMPPTLRGQAEKIVHEHSIFPPHLSMHGMGNPNLAHWSFGLSTVVSDEYVRLTANKQSREGYLWNDTPLHLSSWTAHLGFRVHSGHSLGGDAMALWIAERPSTSGGPVVGTRAHGFKGLGIIFDTFDNDGQRDNPYVTVVSRLQTAATELDLNPANDYTDARIGGCTFDYRNTPKGDVVHAAIEYDRGAKSLSIKLESTRHSETCAVIEDLDIPEGYFFGFTAHTGDVADNHDVHWFVITSETSKSRDQSVRSGSDDAETADARVYAAEHRGEAAAAYDHNKEKEEKERWRATQ